MTKIFNRQEQKKLRRWLRQMPIGCERKLWQKLRNKQLGYKFFRQYGVGKYIVDFYCPELKLVIEVDGATHSTAEEEKGDKERQEYLENLGLKVKRYLNVEIINNLEEVVGDINEACSELSKFNLTPACRQAGQGRLKTRRGKK